MRKIELLAPAKNLECGIAAVDHGADAVYIGASRFGARAAAGNSIEDIRKLIDYAHLFYVRVYVAINTIFYDDELTEAEKLIKELLAAGVDAIIVQDMAVLKMNIPPVVLHASTQTDNRTIDKVKFLQNSGFSRVVLARELTLKQIKEIADNTKVELEAFVHGALCVSYSGQCYISQAITGRSANRGECAQFCRLPYDLTDNEGNKLIRNKHLLSLKDLDLSEYLEDLLDAGAMSLKIEGRLKDIDYVKNITAHYRQKLDKIFASNKQYFKSSSGEIKFYFEPNPDKSFRRSSTNYFLQGRHDNIHLPDTPKSTGEEIGVVKRIKDGFIELLTNTKINQGDGLCFVDSNGNLAGFQVNKVRDNAVMPHQMPEIALGTLVFRNKDNDFERVLRGKTAERKLAAKLIFKEIPDGFELILTDENENCVQKTFQFEKEKAKNETSALENIQKQLSKAGDTIFNITEVEVITSLIPFLPVSVLNDWRRQILQLMLEKRIESYKREVPAVRSNAVFPERKLTYLGNVNNKLAYQFYSEHSVNEINPGFEVKAEAGVPLMFTKHCIKYELGFCPKTGCREKLAEPLFLNHQKHRFRLDFDCLKCEMKVILT